MHPSPRNSATPNPNASPLSIPDGRTRAEMAALRDEELATLNLDVPLALAQRQIALPGLYDVEALVLQHWRNPRVGQLERLQRYASALLDAHKGQRFAGRATARVT